MFLIYYTVIIATDQCEVRSETVDDTFEQCGNVELKATCLVDSFDLGTSLNCM